MPVPFFEFAPGVMPVCEIGMSGIQTAEPTSWLDVSCYVHTCEIFRGRDRFTDRFQPGTASITFSNSDGWGDLVGVGPAVAAAPLRPGRPIRIGVHANWPTGGVQTRWLYRGWIDQCTPRYDPVEHDVVDVNCIDSWAEAGSATLAQGLFQGANETVSARMHRVLDALGWFSSKRRIDSTSTTVQGTTLGSAGIDLMGQAADSAGGVVYGDTDGDVVFRDRNWMLYDPDDPPDGTIGNTNPGTPGTGGPPPYVDPGGGVITGPPQPDVTRCMLVKVCFDGSTGSSGTLVQEGSKYRMSIEPDPEDPEGPEVLTFRSSGRTWRLGAVTIPVESPEIGVGVIYCPGPPPTAQRIDKPPDTNCEDEWPPILPPEPPTDVDGEPVVAELLAFDESAVEATTFTLGPVTPGPGALLVLLLSAICDGDPPVMVAPDADKGTVTGGDLDWKTAVYRPSGFSGAESGIVFAETGRTDPGTFSVDVGWDATARYHAATLWKVTGYVSDLPARMAAVNGGWRFAATNAFPPGSVHTTPGAIYPPGKGFWAAPLLDARSNVAVYTRISDVTIGQSLAMSPNDPWGTVFRDADGLWETPQLLQATWLHRDVFARPDGTLGASYAIPAGTPPAGVTWVPYEIEDGYAIQSSTTAGQAGAARILTPIVGAEQALQLTLSRLDAVGVTTTEVWQHVGMASTATGGTIFSSTCDTLADWTSTSFASIIAGGHTGNGLQLSGAASAVWTIPAAQQVMTYGLSLWFKATSIPGVGGTMFGWRLGSISKLGLRANSDGSFTATGDAGAVIGTTPTGVFAIGTWVQIELVDVVLGPTGSVTLKVGGTTHLTLTGVDLGDATPPDEWGIRQSGHSSVYDDIVLTIPGGGSLAAHWTFDSTADTVAGEIVGYTAGGISSVLATYPATAYEFPWTSTVRVEAIAATSVKGFLDGNLVMTASSPPALTGPYVGFATRSAGAHIEAVEAGPPARVVSWDTATRSGVSLPDVTLEELNIGPDDLQSCQVAAVVEAEIPDTFGWRVADYQILAVDGVPVPGGTIVTGRVAPGRGSIIVVYVAALTFADVAASITVTADGLDFAPVHVQARGASGHGQGAVFWAKTSADTPPPGHVYDVLISWGATDVQKLEYLIWEVTNADTVAAHGGTTVGNHTAGSVTGPESFDLTAAPASSSVVLAFAAVGTSVVATDGAVPSAGWVEEIEVHGGGVAWFQGQTRSGSTSPTVGWDELQADPIGTDAVLLAVEITPGPEFLQWQDSLANVEIGGSRDAFGGHIFYAERRDDDTDPTGGDLIWSMTPGDVVIVPVLPW